MRWAAAASSSSIFLHTIFESVGDVGNPCGKTSPCGSAAVQRPKSSRAASVEHFKGSANKTSSTILPSNGGEKVLDVDVQDVAFAQMLLGILHHRTPLYKAVTPSCGFVILLQQGIKAL